MPRKPVFLLPIALVILTLVPGCADDSTDPTDDATTLLTLHIGGSFLASFGQQGTVFASDAAGNLLDVAAWSEESTIVLATTATPPDNLLLSIVSDYDWGLIIRTELGVPTGTERTYDVPVPLPDGHQTNLELVGAPACDSWRIATNSDIVEGAGPVPATLALDHNYASTDCYVRVDPTNGTPVGAWLENLQADGSATLDFSAPEVVEPLRRYPVTVPAAGRNLMGYLYKVEQTATTWEIYDLDVVLEENFTGDSLEFYGPDLEPLETQLYLTIPGSPEVRHMQLSFGTVPTEFTWLDGELGVSDATVDHVAFTMTGAWTTMIANFGQEQDGGSAQWQVTGPSSIQEFRLPELPETVAEQFPAFPRVGFAMYALGVSHAPGPNILCETSVVYPEHVPALEVPAHARRPQGRVSRISPFPPSRR